MRAYRSTELKRTSRGDFTRNLGFDAQGKVPKFCLGDSKTEAAKRLKAILALWDELQLRPTVLFGNKPAWDTERLAAAQAIAKGNPAKVNAGAYEGSVLYFERINRFRETTGIEVIPDEFKYRLGADDNRKIIEQATRSFETATGQTLHQALQAYSTHVGHEYRSPDGQITDNAKTKQGQIKSITSYVPDLDLAKLNFQGCDEIFGVFRRRPASIRYGTPMTRKTCSNLIGELGRFFLWLHKAEAWQWRYPEDFKLIKRTPRELDEDVERESAPVPTWTIAELKTLYEYANPLERIFMLLGLNCAYGADQAGRLRLDHVKFTGKPDGRSMIRRVRRKKKTLSIHCLWKPTEQGLRWAIERRPAAKSDHLMLTDRGTPYWRVTKGGNRSQDIPNLWSRLLNRVKKDHAEFRRLPFNSLRDTSGNFIRRIAGGETASVHLAHKHQTRDENLNRYTNPTRRRHFKALIKLERKLATVFESIENPFPSEQAKVQKEGGTNITLGQIRRIRSLAKQGFKKAKIAELVGVSSSTVWRYCRKPK
jgi:hypothetical protein